MTKRASMNRDPHDTGMDEPIFLFVDDEGLVAYSCEEWRTLQSEFSAAILDEQDWQGTWTVILPGANTPEDFTVEGGKEVRYSGDENHVVYGSRALTLRGKQSGLTYDTSVQLLDV